MVVVVAYFGGLALYLILRTVKQTPLLRPTRRNPKCNFSREHEYHVPVDFYGGDEVFHR